MAAALSYLILFNVSKRKNHGEILRSAAAMGVSEVAIVGATKLLLMGSHGAASHLAFVHFRTLAEAVTYFKQVRFARIVGIEITPSAASVFDRPFHQATAFMIGNEGTGLSAEQLAACDEFVYIPQYSNATASLNVNAACALVLAHFAAWAGFAETRRGGEGGLGKFEVVAPPSCVPHSGIGPRQMKTRMADGTLASANNASASDCVTSECEETMLQNLFDDASCVDTVDS